MSLWFRLVDWWQARRLRICRDCYTVHIKRRCHACGSNRTDHLNG